MAESPTTLSGATTPSLFPKPSLVLLVDGHSLAFRSYFAHAKGRDGGLRTSTGIPTSISFGFLKTLLEVITAQHPNHVAIAFDLREPTFRHEADHTYKEGRPETPEDFHPDLENLQELLRALNIPVVTAAGYEADDVIGTLAERASHQGYQVKILSGDQDLFQLIDPDHQITVLHLSGAFAQREGLSGSKEFLTATVEEKLGILPAQVVDYKALCGDSSDNIPGVRGIGPKTAVQLLKTYGSLDQIYQSLEKIQGTLRQKLEVGRESALHSQFMARIVQDVPLELTLADCQLRGYDRDRLVPLLQKLEFRQFLNQLDQIQETLGGTVTAVPTPDLSPADSESGDLWFFSADDTAAAQQQLPLAMLKDHSPSIAPQIIDTPALLNALIQRLQTHTDPTSPVAWDTETTGLEPRDAELVGIGCCWGEGRSDIAYIPVGHQQGQNLDKTLVLESLRPILENPTYPKVLQNAKFDRLVLCCQGLDLAGVVFDPMLASYLLNPDASHNLTDLAHRYLGITATRYTDLVPKGKTIADIGIAAVAVYCGMDAYATFCLVLPLQAELAAIPALQQLLQTVEQPLEPVLAGMEYTGIRIDQPYLQTFSQALEQDLAAIERRAYAAAGETFNLSSPKQLGILLFETLQLDRRKSRKTKTGYSTDAATLEKLQDDHPVVEAILEHRTLSKLKSTYVDALPLLVRADTQRVHTDFNQAVTTTGRLSSSHPNLQNIPIRTAFSRQIRKAFMPESGWLLAAADYSQIELRILAHLSHEPVLVTAYQQHQDVHTLTAQLLFEKETISSEERRLGKIINFGVIYGMGAQRFAREANVKAADAKVFIDRFNQRYPLVFAYLQRMQRQAIAQGYVETILGRRRYFNFNSENLRKLRGCHPETIDLEQLKLRDQGDAALLRAAANAPIQGSSADIIKIAMVRLHQVLKSYQARLLLQVHDELVLELPPEEWPSLQVQITTTMEQAVTLRVPLRVEIHTGQNWMETK
ncbi:DNA polymerase I [Neosynechococcus sphagnicola sy1]|uniref:DNA polymerase I n=1 Tax=Neosynechococcus sphagnicola sy1 TaxID=1497020 RepID=A0A098TPB4_9CYAN|nr:DNA polymerase I [Neosynechococcus sphagnicola]KGF73732.1 DNA polymerase I [Neosynechococcus sphagnicola sy1]